MDKSGLFATRHSDGCILTSHSRMPERLTLSHCHIVHVTALAQVEQIVISTMIVGFTIGVADNTGSRIEPGDGGVAC